MSYDLQIWSVSPWSAADLPEIDGWKQHGDVWTLAGRGWQIVAYDPIEVDPEDVPAELGPTIAGIRYQTNINLEPVHAPKAAHAKLNRIARTLAGSCCGVVLDLQTGETYGRVSTVRLARPPRELHPAEVVALSWWFNAGPLLTSAGIVDMLKILERFVPQFFPKRYGAFEPPKHVFSWERAEHFADAALADELVFVWKSAPLFDVSFNRRHGPGWRGQGYFLAHLQLTCPSEYLDEPNIRQGMEQCWTAISKLAQPIYGDVRILGGYVRSGNRYIYVAGDPPDPHPVHGPWRGLPRLPGLAIAIGEPYFSLWPQIQRFQVADSLAMVGLEKWRATETIMGILPTPPEDLLQPSDPYVLRHIESWSRDRRGQLHHPTDLAATWPFPIPKPID